MGTKILQHKNRTIHPTFIVNNLVVDDILSLIGCDKWLQCILLDQACLHEWPWVVPNLGHSYNKWRMNVSPEEVIAPGIKNGWLSCNQGAYLSFCQCDMIENTKERRGRDEVFCGLAHILPPKKFSHCLFEISSWMFKDIHENFDFVATREVPTFHQIMLHEHV